MTITRYIKLAAAVGIVGVVAVAGRLVGVWSIGNRSLSGSQVFDFGEGRVNRTIQHTFRVYNPTSHSLRVTKVQSSCGCTVLKADLRTIGPFATVELPVELNLGAAAATVFQRVTIFFAEREPIQLSIRGKVVEEFPNLVNCGDILRGNCSPRQFVFRSWATAPLTILGANYDSRYLSLHYEGARTNVRDIEFTVAVKDDVPFGPFKAIIQVTTNDADEPIKRVKVTGNVWRPLEVRPRSITIVMDDDGRPDPAKVEVYSPYGRRVTFGSVQVSRAGALSIGNPIEGAAGKYFCVPIQATGTFGQGVTSGTIRFEGVVDGVPHVASAEWYIWAPRGNPAK